MSEWPMRGHFRYLHFKTFSMTPRTPQCEVFWALLLSSKHSGVPEDSKPPTFPSVGLHPHTWPKWGCDTQANSDSQDSPQPGLRGSHHLPLYSILCAFPRGPHPNGFLSWDSQVGVPKLPKLGLSQLWGLITLCVNLRLK